ncbi:MAG: hypothetical protein ACFFB5_08265 [Promethearchaeota archaeon]
MALVLAFENIVALLTVPFLAIVPIVSLYRYLKQKHPHFLYLALDWGGLFFWMGLTTISTILLLSEIDVPFPFFQMTLATFLGYIGYFVLLPSTLFLLLFVDYINRTSVDPIKTTILGLIVATVLIYALVPGQAAKDVIVHTYYAAAMLYSFRSLLWTYYAVKLSINSPQNLERYSIMVLVGTIFMGIIPSINIITTFIPPGLGINEILFLIGIILMAIPFTFQPQIFFLLPYKTSRLAVFNNEGILLFSHRWISTQDTPTGEAFFSEETEGISTILKESLHYPNVREIHLDKSILVINHKSEFSFVLVTVKTSKLLINTLESFSEKFVDRFEAVLPEAIIKEEDYKEATTLISECFQFVPTYT